MKATTELGFSGRTVSALKALSNLFSLGFVVYMYVYGYVCMCVHPDARTVRYPVLSGSNFLEKNLSPAALARLTNQ